MLVASGQTLSRSPAPVSEPREAEQCVKACVKHDWEAELLIHLQVATGGRGEWLWDTTIICLLHYTPPLQPSAEGNHSL